MGKTPAEDHRLHVLEAGERLGGGPARLGDGVADLRVVDVLHVRDDDAHLARDELAAPGVANGAKTPSSWTSNSFLFDQSWIFCFGASVPSNTRTSMTTPR